MIIPLARCVQESCKKLLFYHYGYFPDMSRLDGVSRADGEEPYSVTFQVKVEAPSSKIYTITITESL